MLRVNQLIGFGARRSSGGGGPASTYYVELTIGSGEVGSNLADFPVYVRLSDMPSGFWAHVKPDGGDIRVRTTGGSLVPMDLAWFDYADQDGVLFFKASSVLAASDNVWRIHYGDPADDLLPYTDTNGRNAVWSAYEAVFLLGANTHDRKGGNSLSITFTGGAPGGVAAAPCFFSRDINTTPSGLALGVIQGVCWDGTHYYVTQTNRIWKYDATWSLVASNTNPLGSTGLAVVDHVGDPDVHDGMLYVPVEFYSSSGPTFSNQHICVFNASTLAFVTAYDVSAQGHECSSIAYCPRDGLLYVSSYTDGSKLWRYQLDGTYVSALTLSATVSLIQGVTWWRDAFWLGSDSGDKTWRCEFDGALSSNGLLGLSTNEWEGLAGFPGGLLQSYERGGAVNEIGTWNANDLGNGAGAGASFAQNGHLAGTGRASLTTYTLGATVSLASTGSNRTAVSYWRAAAGTTNTRQVIAYRTATPELALWDVNNTWLSASPTPFNPSLDTPYRVHAVYEGTTRRRMYIDGALQATQTGISAVPSTLDTILIGREDDSNSEPWRGEVAFVYLYPGALSADWIAAEYSNLNAPSSFYSLGSEVPV